MRLILALLFLAMSSTCATAQSEGSVVAAPDLTPAPSEDFDLRAELTTRFSRTFEIMQREFPDDYAAMVASLAAISWQGVDDKTALVASFEVIKTVRRKYADRLRFAPTVALGVMLGLLADFYDAVARTDGAQVCARFALDGSSALFGLGLSEKYIEELDLQSVAFFDAVAKAIETPEFREVAAESDWIAVYRAMVEAGAPQRFVEVLTRGELRAPELCTAYATLFRAAGLIETPEANRVRGDLAQNLAGY